MFAKGILKIIPAYTSKVSERLPESVYEHFRNHCPSVSGIGVRRTPDLPIYKVKKFACRTIPGKGVRTGLRLIYVYFPESDTLELIEIYFKGDKEREDGKRIKTFKKQLADS